MRPWRFILVLLFGLPFFTMAASRDEQWRAVREAMDKGLPQSAIAALQPILTETRRENAHAEYVKALALQVVLETRIQGNLPEEGVRRLQKAMTNAPAPALPLLETLLAHAYWSYFQQHRWQFLQRTTTGQSPGEDFTTWDLARILNEIDSHFQKALANPQLLQQTPIGQFDALLEKGTVPDSYRPTLYDFIAHEAITFYSAGERTATVPADQVELEASTPIFDSARDFLAWQFNKEPTNSPITRALQIFHDLLAFHQNDADRSAFLDADLARLVYGHDKAVGENKIDRFQTALERFVGEAGNHPLAALGLSHWASSLQSQEQLVRAHELAQRGATQFPDAPGGKLCRNLVTQIEAPALNLITEEVWTAEPAPIRISYKNLTRVHLRAVSYDWLQLIGRGRDPESLDENQRREILAKQPDLNWSVDLPPTDDYKQRIQEIAAPQAELKAGFYFILASPDPAFTEQNNPITFASVWVSHLAVVYRPRAGRLEGFVLQAESGEPINGAELRVWRFENRWVPINSGARTDQNGFFTLEGSERQRYLVLAQHEGERLALPSHARIYPQPEDRPTDYTFFFTDRSLYRPGQMVHYKGICVHADRTANDYTVLKGRKLTVIFADANGQEVARQTHECNEQGSFSGTFNLPTGRLTGNMSLRVENGPQGGANFNVEEYKRPRFKVALKSPATPAALNKEVTLTGRAETYTGAPVDNANFTYRVVRQIRWPIWRGWFRAFPDEGPKEIAHGTGRTEADGSFKITFSAQPPPDAEESDEPTFHFEVSVDVTDNSGETRSDQRSVVLGFTTFQAELSLDEWQTTSKPVAIKIKTTTLDGEPLAAQGTLEIYHLKEPEQVQRPDLFGPRNDAEEDSADPNHWPLGDVLVHQDFATDGKGQATNSVTLAQPGLYRVFLASNDANGRAVTARALLTVLDPEAQQFKLKLPHLVAAPKWSLEPGTDFVALWGTGYDSGRAFVEIEHRNQILRRFWTEPGRTQQQIQQAVTESMRGGFTLHVTQIRHNRAHLTSRQVDVPWTNKQLKIRWEHFVSKLKPGAEETWTAVITGPDAMPTVAETVAALYDASLDAFAPHQWQQQFGLFYNDRSSAQPMFVNQPASFNMLLGHWDSDYVGVELTYRRFPQEIMLPIFRNRYSFRGGAGGGFMRTEVNSVALGAELAVAAAPASVALDAEAKVAGRVGGLAEGGGEPAPNAATRALDQVSARKNLNETAFFFPHLLANKEGEVRLQFTMPEALTQWRFLAFAHDNKLRSGYLEDTAVTSKEIMIRPNPPRFLREGDTLEFTATVLNQSPTRQTGRVRLTFTDAATDKPVDLKISPAEQSFDIPANQSAGFSWRLQVSDGLGILAYKAVAATDLLSDGEEGYLPVIPRKILVTESLPLPINGPATKEFTFTNLLESTKSKTVQHQSLTVQMASQPGWYAVLALPYLMEFPHECTEQTFNRYYANSLARTIATSNPKIQRVFELWKNTPALDSPLEKNEELKNLALEATPWVRDAQSESQARRRIGLLFDQNRVRDESNRILQKLQEQQRPDGAWPWFPGGDANQYITLYITTGFGRLRHLGVDTPIDPAVRALDFLDRWLTEQHRLIVKAGTEKENHLSSTIALHLYTRSFFLKDKPIADENRPALDYFIGQAKQYWLKLDPRQSKAHLALALHRFGPQAGGDTPQAIMRSLKEHAVTDDELGMFWRDTENSWFWDRAPVETQALMIEAFDEIMADASAVELCRVWLLKQKQTQGWKTTKSTADAVYALLLRGANLLASDEVVRVSLDGKSVDPGQVEPGTGFYEQRLTGSDVKATLAHITVAKKDQGVAWGSVHWQYFQDVGEVGAATGTPLKVEKTLHVRKLTGQGPVLEPVTGPIAVGDELIVRIVVRVDRDMEYVHLKDQRGSGTEPVNVLSGYRWQDGLGYYESTRDTASHFFIAYLAKGTYVFEYPTRVVHRGQYQTGLAEIQCMYAPEFNSHSASQELVVR